MSPAKPGGQITIAPVPVGQFDDVIRQTFFIGSALRKLVQRGSVLSHNATGAALRHAQLLPHMVDAFLASRRAYLANQPSLIL